VDGRGESHSVQRAAERGHNLILDQFASAEMLGVRIASLRAKAAARDRCYNPMLVVVARELCVVDSVRERKATIERNNRVRARTLSVSQPQAVPITHTRLSTRHSSNATAC
jgi:hypothetical protein